MANDRQVQDLGDKTQVFRLGSGIIIGDLWIYVDDDGNLVIDSPKGTKSQVFDGAVMKNVAGSNAIAGIPIVHYVLADQAGGANKDVTITHKFRVTDVIVVNKAAGGASDTITVQNGTNAITDAIDTNKADKTVTRAGTIDDAYHEIAAGGTLRVAKANGANDPNCEVYVYGFRVS